MSDETADTLPPFKDQDNLGSGQASASSPQPPQASQASAAQGRDPLSWVLLGGALLLGLMYVLDEWAEREAVGQAQAAAQVRLDQVVKAPCQAEAAGPRGRTLLVRCPGWTAKQAIVELQRARWAMPARFDGVAAIDDAQRVWCERGLSTPLETCQVQAVLSRADLEATRRRRTRER